MTAHKWRKRIAGVALLAVALLVVWMLARSGARSDLGEKRLLPDGSTLELREVVSTATNYNFAYQGGGRLWRMVAPILPPSIRNRFNRSSGSLGWSRLDGHTNLIVVTVNRSTEEDWGSSIVRLRVSDEAGNQHDASWGASTLGMGDGKAHITVHGWRVHGFPRRSKMLGLQFLATKDKNWTNVADFLVANPLYANYPQWSPEPWPNTKQDGDLAVTLKEFQAGARMADLRGRGDAPSAARKTRLVFSFTDNDWRVQKLTISDATGNHWSPYLDFVKQDFNWTTNGTVEFFGALWPGEQAWKLNVEVVRTAKFAPEQLWEVAIPLPRPGIVNPLTNTWESVKLVSVASPETDHTGDFKWAAKWWGANKSKVYSLALSVDAKPKGTRLSVVRCLDEQGREIKIVQHGNQDSQNQAIFFTPPADTAEARLTLALQNSRFVEFLARPQFVE